MARPRTLYDLRYAHRGFCARPGYLSGPRMMDGSMETVWISSLAYME